RPGPRRRAAALAEPLPRIARSLHGSPRCWSHDAAMRRRPRCDALDPLPNRRPRRSRKDRDRGRLSWHYDRLGQMSQEDATFSVEASGGGGMGVLTVVVDLPPVSVEQLFVQLLGRRLLVRGRQDAGGVPTDRDSQGSQPGAELGEPFATVFP